ncbi:Protein of uncharacterised function (DUF3742) [Burkholderia pseudomallei]|uniref:DUF3742 family protein n=1 Tax=Burkholderia pseudomallei TaxID=28450 RepID=UPI0005DF7640|nr:DUF3742 family protein [Burkholderia pseudomallei]CAK1313893.1 Protein of uncharacterised function (DUF3742) [Burkholderia pseudomallei]
MRTTAHSTVAERVGRGLGRAWFAIRRQEARVVQHLMHQGLSRGIATLIMWAVKLLVLGVLLYVAFWLTLVAIFVLVAAWLAGNADDTADDKPQWRNGLSGYGLYRGDVRVDPGTTDDE